MYRSEIRDSLIAGLLDRVQKNSYSKYLRSMHITNARHLKNAAISFDFPVTALIGPNGGGKSTVLALAACTHKGVVPRNFFFVSLEGDTVETVAKYECAYINKSIDPKGILKKDLVIDKSSLGVSVGELARHSKYFGSHRIIPPTESPYFMRKRLSGRGKSSVTRETYEVESEDTRKHAEKILGKSLRDFSLIEIVFSREKLVKRKRIKNKLDEQSNPEDQSLYSWGDSVLDNIEIITEQTTKKVVVGKQLLFVGASSDGGTYSEFNFGAGEASVLRMVAEIEHLPESSLVLVEEVENGLHPLAVTRLVEYLIEVSERKKLQVIFTTHSEYALMPLPSEAIWASVNGELIRGHLSIESLRAITGRFDKQLGKL